MYILQVPIYPGAKYPLVEQRVTDYYYGNDGFGDVFKSQLSQLPEIQNEHAVLFLIRKVKEFPKKITIVALGPLTNIALAIKLEPNFLDYVGAIVWTGGSVEGFGNVKPGIEFNAYFDPAANFVVFNQTKRPVIVVSWELIFLHARTTLQWRKDVLGNVGSKVVEFINAIEEHSMQTGFWGAADVKTMFIAMNFESVTRAEFFNLQAIYEGEHTKGLTLVDYNRSNGKSCNAIVIGGMDVEVFLEKLLQVFSTNNTTNNENATVSQT